VTWLHSNVYQAWKLWIQDQALKFIDPTLGNSYLTNEVFRCFHIGLLCVQGNPDERPTMSTVLLMLNSDQMQLPLPTEPRTCARANTVSDFSLSTKTGSVCEESVNDVTITLIDPR
jgi:hypothetical protein